ncbi:hypothetical protein IRJ41_003618 [Triplophysa rosa]|uniref:Uncharacterized protein n=1 Tax=Triplophysa rosa TaxID=992332 RepID=A0A9W7X1R9_TRIRA|nr:hypothetical protein IRJ41_003618 [Triplophysa rosa]
MDSGPVSIRSDFLSRLSGMQKTAASEARSVAAASSRKDSVCGTASPRMSSSAMRMCVCA